MLRFMLLSALVGLPLLELYLLLRVGGRIGVLATLLLLIAAAIAGTTLVRRAGLAGVHRVRAALAGGELPARPLLEATLMLIAGGLLVLPGFLSDILGLCLLLPALRRSLVEHFSGRRLARTVGRGRVIQGEYRRDERER